jgi:hypothetical protein
MVPKKRAVGARVAPPRAKHTHQVPSLRQEVVNSITFSHKLPADFESYAANFASFTTNPTFSRQLAHCSCQYAKVTRPELVAQPLLTW